MEDIVEIIEAISKSILVLSSQNSPMTNACLLFTAGNCTNLSAETREWSG